ncbi:MAG TPA: T9SS type B sorting domain-containing protein, partial [Flavisolibacter sp.]|nr:T9SS type B sorting domain-containing protein [Flavisolibacter sp.]
HQNNGSGIVSPSGGTPPYSFSMNGINYSSGSIFNNLAPGLYNFSVKDASGFSSIHTFNIQESCPSVSLSATYAGCHLSNGTVTATGSGGQGPYTFSIDGINFQTNNIFSNLVKGNYTITIKDALGNTATSQVIVNENCVQVQATVTNATCNQFNGSAILTGSNGTPPYQYSIDGNYYTTLNTFGALNANTYTAYIKDVNGNTGITSFVITTTPAPQLSAVIVPASCSKNNGSIILSGTGGTSPYLFSSDKASYLPSNTFSNLNPGNYSYYLKDASGCIVGTSFDIGIDCPQITASTQHESCSRQNGSISAVASNGALPYTYSLDGIHFQNSNQFLSLHSGNYTVTVKDSLEHWSQVNVTVNNVCPLLTVKGFDGLCKDSSARIEATTENGIPPYKYSLDGVNFKTTGMYSNLPAGTYLVTVKDSENNLVNAAVTLTNYLPPQLKVIASPCTCANSDGILQLQTHGGFLPLRFSIDSINFKTDSIFKNLPSGTYTASVKDKAGCLTTQNVLIDIVDNLILYENGSTTICEGDHTTITTNSNADSYSWIPNTSISDPHAKNPSVTPHSTTSYIVTASLGVCSRKDSVIITVLSAPIVNAPNDTTLCYGQSVQLFASGAQFYYWSPSLWLNVANQSDPVVQQPQKTVTYSVTGTDNNGCSSLQPANVTVIVTPPAKIFAGNDTSIAIHQPLQLKAIDVNNSRFLQYTWTPATGLSNPDIPNPIATPSKDTKYYLQAVTSAGCIGLDTINVKVFNQANIWVPNAFTPNGDGLNDKLHPVLVGIKSLLYFRVFDRWGNITYQTASDHDGWDGTNKGINKPSDTYVWIAEGIDYLGNKIFRKGAVTLIR